MSEKVVPQWEQRVELFKYIYGCLLSENDGPEIIEEAHQKHNFDADQMRVLEYWIDNNKTIIVTLSKNLNKTWTWQRLSYIDQALLIEAYSESQVLKTPKAVLIDQTIITARKYSDDQTYKFINAILDKVL